MNKELRERDLLWCKALIATLGTDEIEKVTAEFNRIRPDKAVEHHAHLTPETQPNLHPKPKPNPPSAGNANR